MERRQEPRFASELWGTLTILGLADITLPAYVEEVSEGGARIAVTQALEPGSFIRLEIIDTELYCEVRYCCRRSSAYMVGLLVERSLFGPSHLSQLIEHLLQPSLVTASLPPPANAPT